MVRFFSFSLFLFISFLLEQTILLPFGLSPGGFFVQFLALCLGLFFLERESAWRFLAMGGIIAGLFSVTPLFSFLLFITGGILFLFMKRFVPIEGVFSFLAAVWLGAASYFAAFFVLWGSSWMFEFLGTPDVSSFRLFFAQVVPFALWLLVLLSIVWGLGAYLRGNGRSYMLR